MVISFINLFLENCISLFDHRFLVTTALSSSDLEVDFAMFPDNVSNVSHFPAVNNRI